jgi:hypothetical protein
MPGIFGRAFVGGRFDVLRRLYRWLNLTIIQQAVWPLMVLVFNAPAVDAEETPPGWFIVRLAGPCAAALLAWIYIRRPRGVYKDSRVLDTGPAPGELARQARWFALGLPVMVAVVRIAAGPADDAIKIALLGLAEVAAYHLISFWIVPLSFPEETRGVDLGTALFGVSWGLHDLLLVGANNEGSLVLAFLAGLTIGLVVAVLSRLLYRWPGGAFTAAAVHWLVIYLIFGFAG